MGLEKKYEIEMFLNYAKQNLGDSISTNDIYELLRSYGLKASDMDGNNPKNTTDLYEKWQKKFTKSLFFKPNFSTYRFPNDSWYGFRSEKESSNQKTWIKLYLAIDYQHLEEGVNQIVSFLNQNPEFEYDMKVAGKMRSDNVVVRIKDEESANKLIEFINKNEYLQAGRNSINPFIPNVDGVGKIAEIGGSYNDFISYSVATYLNENNNISYESFASHLQKNPNYLYEKQMKSYFDYDSLNKEEVRKSQIDNEQVSQNKINTLLQASLLTYQKYQQQNQGYEQLVGAIKNVIYNNNYQYFTNQDDVRKKLIVTVFPEEMKMVIINTLGLDNNIDYNLDELIGVYVGYIYEYQQQIADNNSLETVYK